MRLLFPKKVVPILVLIATAFGLSGCAVIAGSEDDDLLSLPFPNIQFIESLRNEESLQGGSYREITAGNSPAASLQRPTGVYADQFRVYVIDTAPPARILIFNRAEGTVSALNIEHLSAGGEGRFLAPASIAVDASGLIFVSDFRQGRVFGFDRNGKLLLVLGRPQIINMQNGPGEPASLGELASPAGLALDAAANRLYIADLQGQVVRVFDTLGSHLYTIGRSGGGAEENFTSPTAVALDRAGSVYVLDSIRLGVYVYSPDGSFQRSFSLKGVSNPGIAIKPSGIAVDSGGNIYVSDAVNNAVLIFDHAGGYLVSWGSTGKLFGDFWTPSGIFIDRNDYIYVADQTNSRIQVFQLLK